MALLDREASVSRLLRKILSGLPSQAGIDETNGPQLEPILDFYSSLEYFLAAVLGEIHPEWLSESFDGFLPILAIKRAENEAEFFGPCVMISDQTWAPFHLKIRVADDTDEVSWLDLKVGEKISSGMQRSSLNSVYNRIHLCNQNPALIDWAYAVTFGGRDPT